MTRRSKEIRPRYFYFHPKRLPPPDHGTSTNGAPDRHPGRVADDRADQVIAVPGSSDTIVIGDTEVRAVRYVLLRRMTPDGTELWRAAPPNGAGDAWVFARVDGNEVVARSWSCYVVWLDLDIGSELRREFTK